MRKLFLITAVAVSLLSAKAGISQERFPYSDRNRTGTFAFDGSIGFMLDPDAFLLGVGGDYFLFHHFSLGPLLQLGVSDDVFVLAPTLNMKGVFDIPAGGFAHRVKPFVQGGAGL